MLKFMLPSSLTLSVILAFFLCIGATYTQSPSPKATMVANAVEMEVFIPRLLPAVQKVREAANRRSFSEYFNTCLAISKNVIRAGEKMSDKQFKQFEMEYLAAYQGLPNMNCGAFPPGLEKTICECKAGGGDLTKCVSDKAPPEGY